MKPHTLRFFLFNVYFLKEFDITSTLTEMQYLNYLNAGLGLLHHSFRGHMFKV